MRKMQNIDVARVFHEVADLLDIQGANPFRIRAYRAAARTIETLGTPVASLVESDPGALEALPGIGADLAGKIATVVKTGRLPLLRELSRKTPVTLTALMRIPGLGPKRARLIHDTLGVKTLTQLEKAARAGRLREVKGIGPTLEQTILRGLRQQKAHAGRVTLSDAEAHVRPLRGVHCAGPPASGDWRWPAATGAGGRPSATSTCSSARPAPVPSPSGSSAIPRCGRSRRTATRAARSCSRRACRSICASCRRARTARRSTTSPDRSRTTSPSAGSR